MKHATRITSSRRAPRVISCAVLLLVCFTPMAKAQSTSSSSASGGSWSNEATQAMSAQGCNPVVAKAISNTQEANIRGRTQLANDLYKRVLANLKYETLSCLNNLLPGMIFQRPSASSLRSEIESYICQAVDQAVDPVVSNINSQTGALMGGANSLLSRNLMLGTNSYNLGAVQTGFQLTGGTPLLTPIRSLYAVDGNSSYNTSSGGSSGSSTNIGNILSSGSRVNIFGR